MTGNTLLEKLRFEFPLVYVLILNWNQPEVTLACVASLLRSDYPSMNVLLIDNGSDDESVSWLQSSYPQLEMLCLLENLGFAGGMNIGIRYAIKQGAEYVFLLNNDTIVAPSALSELITVATKKQVAMVTAKIFYADKPTVLWSVGGKRNSLTLEMTDKAIGERDSLNWQFVCERDYLVGCALLVSVESLQKVGLFDERFFMYYEDMDLSLRMQRAGYRLLLAPQAHVWHKVAQSSGGRYSPMERYWVGRSSVLFFRKNVRRWQWLFVFPYRLGSAVRTTIRLFQVGNWSALLAYWRGCFDGLRISVR